MYYDADCLLAMLRGLRLSGTHWNEVSHCLSPDSWMAGYGFEMFAGHCDLFVRSPI